MREIKFRSFDKNKKVMIYDFDQSLSKYYKIRPGNSIHQIVYQIGLLFDSLMQCTGTQDNNEKDIYEGDFIKIKDHSDEIQVVVFWRNMFCAESLWGKSQNEKSHFNWKTWANISGEPYIPEVIGNIYQNPELLEKS